MALLSAYFTLMALLVAKLGGLLVASHDTKSDANATPLPYVRRSKK
jgi:hypothetical protein